MSIHEIVLPETKPETEWILGRAVRKVSPFRTPGAALVIVVDPRDRSVRLHDTRGVRVLCGTDVIEHRAVPGFSLALPALFAPLDRRR